MRLTRSCEEYKPAETSLSRVSVERTPCGPVVRGIQYGLLGLMGLAMASAAVKSPAKESMAAKLPVANIILKADSKVNIVQAQRDANQR